MHVPSRLPLLAALFAGVATLLPTVHPAAAPANPLQNEPWQSAVGKASDAPFWLSWTVPATPEVGFVCCFDGMTGQSQTKGSTCKVESREQGWSTSRDRRLDQDAGTARVLAKVRAGKVERVVAYSRGCALTLESPVRDVTVTEAQSLALLRTLALEDGRQEESRQRVVAAIGLHASQEADAALIDLASSSRPRQIREDAIFWIGQTRGERSVAPLAALLKSEPTPKVREHILFSLSQTGLDAAARLIEKTAYEDAEPDVRSQACFWLAQSESKIALPTIQKVIREDRSSEVREQCVFALSQLPDSTGTTELVALARTSRDADVRRQALFWLGQSDDPRALDLLSELLQK
jgi:hypothetical protein